MLKISQIKECNRLLEWHINSVAETGFRIERRLGGTGIYDLLAEVPPNVTSWLDTTVIRTDTDYNYRVLSYNANGTYGARDSVAIRLPFPAPFNLHVVSQSSSSLRVEWSDTGSFAGGYIIERRTRNSAFQQDLILPGDSTGFTTASLDTAQDYQYRIKAFTAHNQSVWGDSIGVMRVPLVLQLEQVQSFHMTVTAMSRDGSLVLFPGYQPAYTIFDLVTNQVVWTTNGDIFPGRFSGDNKTFISWPRTTWWDEVFMSVVNISNGTVLQDIQLPRGFHVSELFFNHDGSRFISEDGNQIYVWDTGSKSQVMLTPPHPNGIFTIALSPDDRTIACMTGSVIEFWDIPSGKMTATITGDGGEKFVSVFGPNNNFVNAEHGSLNFWDLATHSLKSSFSAYFERGGPGDFISDGRYYIASIPVNYWEQKTYGVWRVSDGILLGKLPYAPSENSPDWVVLPGRFPMRDVIQTIDREGRVFHRRFCFIWGQHDW